MSNPWSQSYEDLRNSIDEASSSYLEKDMKKRQKNNEKARKEMEKMGSMKNPHFGSGPAGSMSSEEVEVDEAMSSYDRNRKRAAQRAAERNAARAAGKTGVVPGVGYVSPRKERETYVDSAGTTRHKSGAKMEGLDPVGQEDKDIDNDGDHDKSDKYLAKRRKAIGKAMKNQKEDWRSSLGFIDEAGCSDDEGMKDMKKIGKGEVKNKINVMPNVKMGKQNESANLCPVCGYEPCQCPPEQRTEALQVPQQENPKRQQKMSQAAAQYSKSKKKSADFPTEENRLSDEALEKAAAATQKRHKEQGYKVPGTGAMDDVRARIVKREQRQRLQMQKQGKLPLSTEELDFYLDNNAQGSLWQRVKEASWDMKTGKSKDPKQRAKDAQKAAEMKARDKRAGRRTYGSAKLGYAKKDWDE